MSSVFAEMTKTVRTWNGAISNSTTGSYLLDYFSKCGTYTNRPQSSVNEDMQRIFAEDPVKAIKLVFGIRLISRKGNTGYGRRDEFYKCVKWILENKPNLIYNYLHLIPVFGSWKDLFNEPFLDILDKNCVYDLVNGNLQDNLLLKYLPQIRSKPRSERDKKRSQWAKGFCRYLGISFSEYRKLKSQGTGHIWQKQMSSGKWDSINFNGIPGKAMFLHTSRKGKTDKLTVFERHGLVEKLKSWLLTQKTVKFTGYPYQLLQAANKNPGEIQKFVYNKQFENILETFKEHKLGNVLACLDISSSMLSVVTGNVTAMDICLSMGLVFSALNLGHFKDTVCGFSNEAIVTKLYGTFCERLNILNTDKEFQRVAWGSTNFQGVIDLLVRIRSANPQIPLDEYPETLLICSDMQFNQAYCYTGSEYIIQQQEMTNYALAKSKLKSVGLNEVRIIWWHLNGQNTTDFPSNMNDKGVYMISGFSPENLRTLIGGEVLCNSPNSLETPMDGMNKFLNQPIFELLSI